jgi:hypothetical protein
MNMTENLLGLLAGGLSWTSPGIHEKRTLCYDFAMHGMYVIDNIVIAFRATNATS